MLSIDTRLGGRSGRAAAIALAILFLSAQAPTSARGESVSNAASKNDTGPTVAVAVAVTNSSKPTQCAEEDNVTLAFAHNAVTSFTIEANHPAYLAGLTQDSTGADWAACSFTTAAVTAAPPRRETIHETIETWVVLHRNAGFWRDSGAVVRVGDKVWRGVHLVQLWKLRPMGGEEVLVVYPQDGYWRLRPKAPAGRDLTAFGSSFLIGPVEDGAGRPVVRIKELAFDPAQDAFAVSFHDGNSATVAIDDLNDRAHRLSVTLSQPIKDQPFAALRSMYVSRVNADATDVAVLDEVKARWLEAPVLDFAGAKRAQHLWLGRPAPSRHNTSAPDMVLRDFRARAALNGPSSKMPSSELTSSGIPSTE
ncbi:MAG: hypothetical protein AAGG72_05175 [Pseudomonadota bacterium]